MCRNIYFEFFYGFPVTCHLFVFLGVVHPPDCDIFSCFRHQKPLNSQSQAVCENVFILVAKKKDTVMPTKRETSKGPVNRLKVDSKILWADITKLQFVMLAVMYGGIKKSPGVKGPV